MTRSGLCFLVFILCFCIFCYGCTFVFFVVFNLVFSAKTLTGKNVSEMTCFMSGEP